LGVYDRDEARQLAIDYWILDPPKRQQRTEAAPIAPEPPPPEPDRVDWDNLTEPATIVHDRTWIYVDEHDIPVGRVRRLDLSDGQKRIWQERPDGDAWATGLDGSHLPLYRLPDVLERAARAELVLVVEGEKAVDALDRLDVFATTNAAGAGKWRTEHTAALAGATALVICDSDQPGRQHAHDVSAELLTAGVQTLMPLDLAPLRRDGYDIVDDLTDTAATIRAVAPDINSSQLRDSLRRLIRKILGQQLPADPDTLQRWHEHADYLTNPAGRAYITCTKCGEQRVHHLTHGLAYCRCGGHQLEPA
jgi:hypothetical protein